MSQALNKVEMTVKITEIGFLLIKFQNFRSKKEKKTVEKVLPLRRHQLLHRILPLMILK